MRLRTVLIGMFALLFGTSAASGVYLISRESGEQVSGDTGKVTVVTQIVERGQAITAESLTVKDWPAELAPDGFISDPSSVVGRVAWVQLVRGEPLLESKLAPVGSKGELASQIPSGMRAVTIQTPNVATGVAGFIMPGNHVDILFTMRTRGANDQTGGSSSITLLQNVEILAVDQQLDAQAELEESQNKKEMRSVTLLVKPEQAARLDLGRNHGTLHLALRNPADLGAVDVSPATLNNLARGDVSDAETETETGPKPQLAIRTLRGSQAGIVYVNTVTEQNANDENRRVISASLEVNRDDS